MWFIYYPDTYILLGLYSWQDEEKDWQCFILSFKSEFLLCFCPSLLYFFMCVSEFYSAAMESFALKFGMVFQNDVGKTETEETSLCNQWLCMITCHLLDRDLSQGYNRYLNIPDIQEIYLPKCTFQTHKRILSVLCHQISLSQNHNQNNHYHQHQHTGTSHKLLCYIIVTTINAAIHLFFLISL